MGHIVERIARERGHDIVSVIDVDNQADFDSDAFRSADVAIEFTTPATAIDNYRRAFAAGVPVVSGSTGWTSRMAEVEQMVAESDASLFWTSNFSVGVNIFFELNKRLARLMEPFPQYRPFMSETHHIHKLDHPSGTAITIADGILEECPRIKCWDETGVVWKNAPEQERDAQMAAAEARARELGDDKLGILTYRDGEVPGIHKVKWESAVDTITIEHSAKSRDGFALGAVIAAEWIAHRKGIFTIDRMMEDIL